MAAKCRRLAPMFEPATAASLQLLAREYDERAALIEPPAAAEFSRRRYYLHLHACGTVTPDSRGSDLRDLAEARDAAATKARAVMAAEVAHGRLCLGCCIVIEDAERRELDRVWFRDAIAVTDRECD